ncbi:MAG: prepilin-type N-terminal cleavage/methylation domain-containing protein [Candidatus Mycalebacterium zealandia]|nr:MAG: prepilin-type N-terminal cleavage/methylation domain-containing protein [Candidatus Mycalebacterium zealandia]
MWEKTHSEESSSSVFRGNKERGFTLLEFLFSAVLLAVLTAVGLSAISKQSKTQTFLINTSKMDHVAHSILSIISDEIKNSGAYGSGLPPIRFVDGGGKIDRDSRECDPSSAKEGGTDCITFESLSYEGQIAIKKSFFVEKGILKIRNSDSSRNQSLTTGGGELLVEDFQIGFFTSSGGGLQNSVPGGETLEAVKVTLTLKSPAPLQNPGNPYEIKTYSVVANPRNIR